jgi:hypothetical protein
VLPVALAHGASLLLAGMGCAGDSSDSAVARASPGSPLPPAVPSVPAPEQQDVTPPAGIDDRGFFRAPWCDGPGQNSLELFVNMRSIAEGYDRARGDDCRTAGLLAPLNESERFRWLDYLIGYSIALAGCPPPSHPVEGGIRVFGPANTDVIGRSHQPLGRDDAGLLIQHYLDSFAPALALSEAERSIVEAQLWSTAEAQLDATATGALSTCSSGSG